MKLQTIMFFLFISFSHFVFGETFLLEVYEVNARGDTIPIKNAEIVCINVNDQNEPISIPPTNSKGISLIKDVNAGTNLKIIVYVPGYSPFSINLTVANQSVSNRKVIVFKKKPGTNNTLQNSNFDSLFLGKVVKKGSGTPIRNADVEYIDSNTLPKNIKTNKRGYFFIDDVQIGNNLIMTITRSGFEKKEFIHIISNKNIENRNLKMELIKKNNFFSKHPLTISSGVLSSAAISIGSCTYKNAKSIYDEYKKYPTESQYVLNATHNYDTRLAAYKAAERKRKCADILVVGGIASLVAGILVFAFDESKNNSSSTNSTSSSLPKLHLKGVTDLDGSRLGLVYDF